MLRKRNIKLLIAIPVLWILVMFVVGMRGNNSTVPFMQLLKEKEKVKSLEIQNKELSQLAVHHKEKFEDQEKLIKDSTHPKEDHDHPEEERIKAEEQARKGRIQVHAPKEPKNPNAPGKNYHIYWE